MLLSYCKGETSKLAEEHWIWNQILSECWLHIFCLFFFSYFIHSIFQSFLSMVVWQLAVILVSLWEQVNSRFFYYVTKAQIHKARQERNWQYLSCLWLCLPRLVQGTSCMEGVLQKQWRLEEKTHTLFLKIIKYFIVIKYFEFKCFWDLTCSYYASVSILGNDKKKKILSKISSVSCLITWVK